MWSLTQIANFFDTAIVIALFIFMILSFYYILYFIEAYRKPEKFEKGSIKYKYAILIPARNEDNVISNILNSLKKQTYDKNYFDVYVIIESKDDPTFNITKKFGYKVIIRKDLVNKRTKGFALQEAYNHLKTLKTKYDALMIFDADNILSANYIKLLNDVKNKGYQVGVGYRNFTNSRKNWVSACSATLFSFMNQFTGKGRSRYFEKATLTGTGYYVDTQVVDDAGGWIWTGFTEDVALTTYCYYHNVSMHYYPHAMYYDEQATKLKILHTQHIRWVFGFFEDKNKYKKGDVIYHKDHMVRRRIGIMEYNLSIFPFLTFIITEGIACIVTLCLLIAAFVLKEPNAEYIGFHCLINFCLLYLSFALAALISILLDHKNLKFGFWRSLLVMFSYFFFFFDFLSAFCDGLVHKKKRTNWNKIEHNGELINAEVLRINNNGKERKN